MENPKADFEIVRKGCAGRGVLLGRRTVLRRSAGLGRSAAFEGGALLRSGREGKRQERKGEREGSAERHRRLFLLPKQLGIAVGAMHGDVARGAVLIAGHRE